jgi:hypothetical protein
LKLKIIKENPWETQVQQNSPSSQLNPWETQAQKKFSLLQIKIQKKIKEVGVMP